MSSFQLQAQKREKLGSLEARRIKKSDRIPAVIYSKNGNINISFDKREFEIEFQKGNLQTRMVEISLDGKKIKAITHKIDLDPVSDTPIHIDLLNCDESKNFIAQPKIVFTNQDKSIGLKKGGFLHVVLRKAKVICEKSEQIPEIIEVDITRLQVGQKVRSDQIELPTGVKFAKKGAFLIASIIGRGKAEEEVAVVAGATAGAAAPAAGATAAPAAAGAAKAGEKKPETKK